MKKLIITLSVAAALLGAAPAQAHLPYQQPDDPTLEQQLKVQQKNLAHARHVLKHGAGDHKKWAFNAIVKPGWLVRERNETRQAQTPKRVLSAYGGTVYQIAMAQAYRLGVSQGEWLGCAVPLISRENAHPPDQWDPENWNDQGSDAYGLGQALPPSKMAPYGADYMTNPATQIRWMHAYVRKYGGWCGANSFQLNNGWY